MGSVRRELPSAARTGAPGRGAATRRRHPGDKARACLAAEVAAHQPSGSRFAAGGTKRRPHATMRRARAMTEVAAAEVAAPAGRAVAAVAVEWRCPAAPAGRTVAARPSSLRGGVAKEG